MRYALVNELEQETENNYRAVDMRMKVAILGPVLAQIWNVHTDAADAQKMYDVCRSLFVKETPAAPWDRVSAIIAKTPYIQALEADLKSWNEHHILQQIERNRDGLFNDVSHLDIKKELASILNTKDPQAIARLGEIQDEVDTGNRLGTKQKVETKVKQKVKQQVRVKEFVQQHKRVSEPLRALVETHRETFINQVKRDPYPPRELIPLPNSLFVKAAHVPLTLEQALGVSHLDLVLDSTRAAPQLGGGVAASELLTLDPELTGLNSCADFSKITVSWNLAQVWRSATPFPIFVPYGFLAKPATDLLVVLAVPLIVTT
jgi:hypothetical protein